MIIHCTIDGSKFKASNNLGKNYTDNLLKTKLNEIDQKIDEYLQNMDKLEKKKMKTE